MVLWHLAHLDLKDTLKTTYLTTVDALLLQVYFVYKKTSRQCREVIETFIELKLCLKLS